MSKKRKTTIPDSNELFCTLSTYIDHDDLRLIAGSDYGYGTDKHLAALVNIKDNLNPIIIDDWCPLEVIQLCRWQGPDSASQMKQHKIRAFCCVIILHYYSGGNCDVDAFASTLGNLLESLLVINVNLISEGQSLFNTLMQSDFLGKEEKVLLPICDLITACQSTNETNIRTELNKVLDLEKKYANDIYSTIDKHNYFFAMLDCPTSVQGWKAVSNYIHQFVKNLESTITQNDLNELCKRLWNPELSR